MRDTTQDLSDRLSTMSVAKSWDPYTSFDWPEALKPGSEYFMSPELLSIYGTDLYGELDEVQRKRLSFYEICNLFSFVLLGERPVVMGMMERMYQKKTMGVITDYLHHFVDEENKHMVMFSMFLNRYLGKIYPEKKLMFTRDYADGEDDLVFYCRVLIVEELGDFYNMKMMKDDRINPLVRKINEYHHRDEARHLAFGRTWTAELFEQHASKWDSSSVARFQKWLSDYFTSSWGDFYNPTMYKDAGLENAYEIRQLGLSHPKCREFREEASQRLVKFFLKHGLLAEAPSL